MATHDYRWQGGRLEALRAEYQAGDRGALLRALRVCARERIAMSEWLADEVAAAAGRWIEYDARTLNEAFGIDRPKGFSLPAARKKFVLLRRVFRRVIEAQANATPIDDGLFEQIGEDIGIGKTTVKEYWREAARLLE